MAEVDPTIRPARLDDAAAVESFTENTWPEHGGDYVPRVFESWVEEMAPSEGTGHDTLTLVAADADDRAVGLLRTALLSPSEAWCGGMRVAPGYRGEGLAVRLSEAAFDWARGRGASVARCMVFSWNVEGLGAARAAGYEPGTEFRWAHPAPAGEAEYDGGDDVVGAATDGAAANPHAVDSAAAWSYWHGSPAREHLAGLALDPVEPWALSSLTRSRLAAAAEEGRLLVVGNGPDVPGVEPGGVRGLAVRVRVSEREAGDDADGDGADDGADGDGVDLERWAEYGVAAWADADAAADLLHAVGRDAASVGADRTRVLIPETTRAVSDAALARVDLAESPDFVLAADLTERTA